MTVQAPLTRETERWWRAVVLAFRESEPRRRHPPEVFAGHPGRPACGLSLVNPTGLPDGDGVDQALRTDLCAALLVQARFAARRRGEDEDRAPWLWLTRQGRLDDDEGDAAWVAAARAACAESGLPCTFVVVARDGWRDPVTGVRRQWARLRRRSARPAD